MKGGRTKDGMLGMNQVLTAAPETATNNNMVSDAQWDFVKGRHILDGIFVANKVVVEARKFINELLLFIVDFEKVYDSVDYVYLNVVMVK